MILLEAGFGHHYAYLAPPEAAVWISLQTTKPIADTLEETLLGFGCHPPALPKIRACLTYSGRYDCCVQSGWISSRFEDLVDELAEIGIALVTDPTYLPPTLRKRYNGR